ncbi:MAG: DEAD/DEAH box helicase [Planctomycetia bacterium]|nr:DEAD/DEAH box helicase [Planctomycetia bacterium]
MTTDLSENNGSANDPNRGKSRIKKEIRSKHSDRKSGRSFAAGFNWGEVDDEVQPEVFIPVKKKKRGRKTVVAEHLPSTLSAVHSDYEAASATEKKRSGRPSAPPKRIHHEEDDLSLPSYGRALMDSEDDDDFITNLLRTADEPDNEDSDSSAAKGRKKKGSKRSEKRPANPQKQPRSDNSQNSGSGDSARKPQIEQKEPESADRKRSQQGRDVPDRKKPLSRSEQINSREQTDQREQIDLREQVNLRMGPKNPRFSGQKTPQNLPPEEMGKSEKGPQENVAKDPRESAARELTPRQLRSLREQVAIRLRKNGFKKDRINSFLNMEVSSPSLLLCKMVEVLLEAIPELPVAGSPEMPAAKITDRAESTRDTAPEKEIPAAGQQGLEPKSADRMEPEPKAADQEEIEKRKGKKPKGRDQKIREERRPDRTSTPESVQAPEESREKKTREVSVPAPVKEVSVSGESSRKERLPNQEDPKDLPVSGFSELDLSAEMLASLHEAGYEDPTPVQKGTISRILAGVDLIGQAKTGTGKTAAFLIPIIERADSCPPGNDPVALIVVPTRELAVQVRDEAVKLAAQRDLDIVACYGGKPIFGQISKLKGGADIVVGTPGRIIDLVSRRALSLAQLHWVVLDEADRMLDIGFRPDIEKILRQTPKTRQTLLFSATLPDPVVYIAKKYMQEPEQYDFSANDISSETIEQYYISVDRERKYAALIKLLELEKPAQAIVFCRTKRAVDKIGHHLERVFRNVGAIHGDLSQDARDSIMKGFRDGRIKILVATDVVGRGIDVSGISHIINYDIPQFCDDYVHRVGRTGRMGREGVAFSLVTVEEGIELTRIEKRINRLLKRTELPDFEAYTNPGEVKAEEPQEVHKPVYGKSRRLVRRAL